MTLANRTKQVVFAGTGAALMMAALPVGAQAQDDEWNAKAGDWMLRGRALAIVPDESTSTTIGGTVDVSTAYTPELDLTYFIFDNIAVELIAALAEHDAVAVDTAVGDVDLGDTWLLPPTLLAQYHFPTSIGGVPVKPYVGAGINYTFFFGTSTEDVETLNFTNDFGWAVQAGIDIDIADDWVFNIDVKRFWIDTEVSINEGAILADVAINPWVFGVGFGYKF